MRAGVIVEWVLILAAMAALWPWTFGYRPPWYRLVLVAALAAMAWVFVRRLGRVRRVR
jgi:membrane protein YdbS with pleckstrin-like domain